MPVQCAILVYYYLRLHKLGIGLNEGSIFFTGGGVTAGIDFGLALVAEIYGEAAAQTIQLSIEYCPQPPFNAGSPATAPASVLEAVLTKTAYAQAIRKQKILDLLKQSDHTQS